MSGEADLFTREPGNPILTPSGAWWEARGVLNPGVAMVDDRIMLVYRAVGIDGFSRFGIAWSDDGRSFGARRHFYEPSAGDGEAQLGVEDPRLTVLNGELWVTYTKASVASVGSPTLAWEPAPFLMRMALARVDPARGMVEERPILPGVQAKDAVLFPRRIGGLFHALVRVYPSMQVTTSPDLRAWSAPLTVLEPRPGTWEGERLGAGPPPIETPWGWLVLYHANESYRAEGNRRHYRMGVALLDRDDPARVLYRHPDPIFSPRAAYEQEGPVGRVVFGTGLVARASLYYLYYGAADGVIGVATASAVDLNGLVNPARWTARP